MMKCRKVLAGALAVAACFFGGTADAALPEEQIDFILNLPVAHGDDLEMRMRENGNFAVTDLDGNGRLELLFLQEMRNGVPEGLEPENENVRSAWECIAAIPVSRKLYAYEVSANGKRLDPVAIVFTDDEIDPDLRYPRGAYRDTKRGITYYDVATLTRVHEGGYRVSIQSVSLQNGGLQIQTLASEYGNYGIYREQGTPEAVFDYAVDRYGNKLERLAVESIASDYAAGCEERFNARIGWRSMQTLREAKLQPGGMKTLMLESWHDFSLEPKEKK